MANFLREWVLGSLDRAVYWFVEILFQIIMDLANLEIFSQSVLDTFARRIYIILGLVMVFKIMISFIQILINPEKMSDKEQGVGNILKRVVIALLLIVFVPTIFKTAREVQNYVIPVIPKVLLGVTINTSTDGEASETMASVGRMMAFYSFLPFFNYDNTSCDDGSIAGTGTQLGASTTVPEIYSVGTAIDHVNDKDCNTTTSKNGYKYNYRWLVSTFVGAYLVYVLVSIAVAIAIRALKFAICEFAAPIPIASYVDPKTSKQTFDTWVSTTWKVYLDLFIRLIIVYFIVFVFDTVFQHENLTIMYAKLNNDWWRCSLVTLFIIVGLLQFAKQAPKFIGDMLGLKGGGDFMGMFKGEGFKQIGSSATAAAAPLGALTAGVGNVVNARMQKKGWKDSLGSGVAGLTSGLWHGGKAALTGKSAKEVFNATTQTPWQRRNLRTADRANGVRYRDRVRAGVLDWAQINDEISLSEGQQKAISTIRSDVSSSKKATFGRIDKTGDISFSGLNRAGGSKTIQELGDLMYDNFDSDTWNNELKHAFGKLDYTVDASGKKKWYVKSGERFGYHDLTAIARNAEQSGVGSLASALGENGYLKLGAQKEIHENTTTGKATSSDGSLHTKFMEHTDITYARESAHQNIAKIAGDVGPITFTYKDAFGANQTITVSTAQEMMDAYDKHQSEFDDALSMKYAEISSKVSTNATAAGRSSNQRWKGSNK